MFIIFIIEFNLRSSSVRFRCVCWGTGIDECLGLSMEQQHPPVVQFLHQVIRMLCAVSFHLMLKSFFCLAAGNQSISPSITENEYNMYSSPSNFSFCCYNFSASTCRCFAVLACNRRRRRWSRIEGGYGGG